MKVIVIYGSPNDKPFMEPAREYFAQENVPYEETVLSAHRDLPELIRFLHLLPDRRVGKEGSSLS